MLNKSIQTTKLVPILALSVNMYNPVKWQFGVVCVQADVYNMGLLDLRGVLLIKP